MVGAISHLLFVERVSALGIVLLVQFGRYKHVDLRYCLKMQLSNICRQIISDSQHRNQLWIQFKNIFNANPEIV